MKKVALCLALASLLVLGGQAFAALNTIEAKPAATLLLPYFEVDLSNPNGINTLFEINNASAAAYIAHVTVWSDLSVPVLDFNVYLTGFDVVPISVRDVLEGNLPQTAPPSVAPGVSNVGAFSVGNPILDEASCDGQLPPPPLSNFPGLVSSIQASLQGQPAPHLGSPAPCAGQDFGDDIARGYITVDVVRLCTLQFPDAPGYFADGGTGQALNDNVLWGNYYYVDTGNSFAQADTLVHVEAEATGQFYVNGDYTFYGRYVDWTGTDDREPLGTTYAARYLAGGLDGQSASDLIVWRDSKINQGPFTCGTSPSWFPLSQNAIVIFDEEENPDTPEIFPVSPPQTPDALVPFPAEAQRTVVNGPSLPTFNEGWLFLNLNTTVTGQSGNAPQDVAQAWVTPILSAFGQFSVGYQAIQLDNASSADSTARPQAPAAQ